MRTNPADKGRTAAVRLISTSSLVGGVLAALIGTGAAAQAGPDPTPVQHWDGSDTTGSTGTANGDGGTGTWSPTNINWVTGPDWNTEGTFQGGTAVFATREGTVTVAGGPVSAARLSFQAANYVLTGDAIQNASTTSPLTITGSNEAFFLNRLVSSPGVLLTGSANRMTVAATIDGTVTSQLPLFSLGAIVSASEVRGGTINGNVSLPGSNALIMVSNSSVSGTVNLTGGSNAWLVVGNNHPFNNGTIGVGMLPRAFPATVTANVSVGGVTGNGLLHVGQGTLTIGTNNVSSEFNGNWSNLGTVLKAGTGTFTFGNGATSRGAVGVLEIAQGRVVMQHDASGQSVFQMDLVRMSGGTLEVRSTTDIARLGGVGTVLVEDAVLTIRGPEISALNQFRTPNFGGNGTLRIIGSYRFFSSASVGRLEVGTDLVSSAGIFLAPFASDNITLIRGIVSNESTLTANIFSLSPGLSRRGENNIFNRGTINGNISSQGSLSNVGVIIGDVSHISGDMQYRSFSVGGQINGNLTLRGSGTLNGLVAGDLISMGVVLDLSSGQVQGNLRLTENTAFNSNVSLTVGGITGSGSLRNTGRVTINAVVDSSSAGILAFEARPGPADYTLVKAGSATFAATTLRTHNLLVTAGELRIAGASATFDFDFFTNNARLVSLGSARGIALINNNWFAHRGLTVFGVTNNATGLIESFGTFTANTITNSGSIGQTGTFTADVFSNSGWFAALGMVPGTVVRIGRSDGGPPGAGSSPIAVVNNGFMGFTNVDVRIENGLTGTGQIALSNANLTIGPLGAGWGGTTPTHYAGWITGTGSLTTLAPVRFTNRIAITGPMDMTSVTVATAAGLLDAPQVTLRGTSLNQGTIGRLDGTVINVGTLTNTGVLRGAVSNRGVLDLSNVIMGSLTNTSGATTRLTWDSEVTGTVTLEAGSALLLRTATLRVAGLSGAGGLDTGEGRARLTLGATGGTFTGAVFGTGTIVSTGAGTQTLATSGLVNFGGLLDVASGRLTLTGAGAASGNASLSIGAGAVLDLDQTAWQVAALSGTGTLTLTGAGSGLSVGLGGATARFDGVIQGAGRLTKVGAGVFTLGGTNSFTGGLVVTGGALELAQAGAASTGAITLDSGTVLRSLAPMTLANAISLPGGVGAGVDTQGHAVTLTGALSGGRLAKLGTGTLTLTGPLSFTGGVEVVAGTLAGDFSAVQGDAHVLGTLILEQNVDATSARLFTGTGALIKNGAGRLTLTGTSNGFTGTTRVGAGTLELSGQLGQSVVTVAAGATLTGTGLTGGLVAQSGSTVAPAAGALGVLSVQGNATLAAGSTFVADVQVAGAGGVPAAAADGLAVSGTAELAGAIQVNLSGTPGSFEQQFTVVQAAGGRTGTFGSLTVNGTLPPAITARMVYDGTTARVTFAPAQLSDVLTGEVLSANQAALVTGLDTATAGGATPSRLFALYTLQPDEIAGAVRMMSGEAYAASAQIAMVDGALASDMALDRSRLLSDTAFFGARGQALAGGLARGLVGGLAGELGPGTGRGSMAWVQVAGTRATAAADGNASGFARNASLVAFGIDLMDPSGSGNWRFGVMAARSVSDFEMTGVGSRGQLTSLGGGVYAGWNGPLGALRLGINYATLDGQMMRSLEIAGMTTGARGNFRGSSTSSYVEFARPFAGPGGMLLEPYSNVSFSQVRLQGLREVGGPVALAVDDSTQQLGFATMGLRTGRMIGLPGGGAVTLTGGVGMRVLLDGDTQRVRTGLAELPTGTNPVAATMLADREFLVEGTISFRLTRQLDASIGYTGAFGGTVDEHGARAALRWSF